VLKVLGAFLFEILKNQLNCNIKTRRTMTFAIQYFQELQKTDKADITEHNLRAALEILLKALTNQLNPHITVLHEPKRQGKFGTPDFKISNPAGAIGYIETKKVDEKLNDILKSDQIKKYLQLNSNLLISDYLNFIWLKGDTEVKRLSIGKSLQDLDISQAQALAK
jgi:hypothetical protein